MKLQSILVPIDFSGNSRMALRYAVEFATKMQGQLHVVYVCEPASFMNDLASVPIAITGEEVCDRAKRQMTLFIEEEVTDKVPCTTEVRTGKPYDQVIKCAKERKTDLIIISTHGYTGLKHVLMGSTAERIVRHATCGVLILRGKADDPID